MTRQELNEFNLLLNSFNQIAARGINQISEKWLLDVLPKSLPFFAHLITFLDFPKLERITINRRILKSNKRIWDIDFLKYPPEKEVKKYGRCNLKQNSVFYGSSMLTTAISEMRPKVGDLITKSIWTIQEKHTFKVCPIFHIQPKNNTFNPLTFELEQDFFKLVDNNFPGNMGEAVVNLSKFIAFHFSKYVDPKNDKDYLFSAYFANKLLNELEGGAIEGILYPSVKEHLSFENVVLKTTVFDKHYLLSEVSESIVIKDPSDGEGGFLTHVITECKDFDYENKKILWNENIFLSKAEMDNFIKKFGIDLS